MKVKFEINPKKEFENLPHLIKLAGEKIIDPKFYERLKNKSGKELYREIINIHKEEKSQLVKIKEFIERNWRRAEGDYISNMEFLTGQKIRGDKIVLIAPIINGAIADVIGRKNAFIGMEFNGNALDYLVMHEIIHLCYSDIINKFELYDALKSPLMEGVDHMLLFKSPLKKLLNKKVKYDNIGFVQANRKFMNSLERIWETRTSFKQFIKQAILLQNKTEGVKIC